MEENKVGTVLGHPSTLFVLFFTEMWERFSYYGMRALLVLFLTASLMDGGYGWENENALQLYALYTGLVYFTPMIGGAIADQLLGYRKAVILGALIMAIGHGSLALETPGFFYIGLLCLIIGNGLFKPNISSMVGQLYDDEEKKDGAYSIFYMGINAGAFLGIGLCGYIGENYSWSLGFGLAGIFMLLGMLQFWFARPIFGEIGSKPMKDGLADIDPQKLKEAPTKIDSSVVKKRIYLWSGIGLTIGIVIYVLLRMYYPMESDMILLKIVNTYYIPAIILATGIGIVGYIVTDPFLQKFERQRVWVIVILTFFTIFFWWAFEQAGGSMTIFARDYTNRSLEGNGAFIFNVANATIFIGALGVITWVLLRLFSKTFSMIKSSNSVLAFSFLIIWGIVIWKVYQDFSSEKLEVPASWFSILNSFFIITLAPLFSRFWESKTITSGPVKFGGGLIILGLGFAILSWGSGTVPDGSKTASLSMIWLILAYFFHTSGELCVSPVGLSYVSKLAPLHLIGILFGVWFLANFIANWLGGMTGSKMDEIVESYGVSTFFLIFTIVPIAAGLVLIAMKGFMKKMMHGID